MCEGLSYLAGAELPCVVVNVVRGGPGLGTIQPGQGDYFQACKGGGHGDYKMVVLAPSSAQEMYDFVDLGFDLAFKYLNPVLILADGVVGQMMEKVELKPMKPRWSDEFIKSTFKWATTGKTPDRKQNVITSLALDAAVHERLNHKLQLKYKQMQQEDVRFETFMCEDAEHVIVAYGCMARICENTVELARAEGIKLGLLRPITLFPFPTEEINRLVPQLKTMMSVELSAGQMVEDVRLAVNGRVPVNFFGRLGGIVPSPEEVFEAFKKEIK
jgi:2-oxoglutarate ferredoxin oxidoreductase subunit alpha